MKKAFILILLAVVVFGLPFIKSQRGKKDPVVEVAEVSFKNIASTVLASGKLTPIAEVSLRPEVSGSVAQILVTEGQRVTAGDLVLLLDDEAFRSDVAQREADLRIAKLDVDRQKVRLTHLAGKENKQKNLAEKGLVSSGNLEDFSQERMLAALAVREAEERVAQVTAALDKALENLAKTRVHAPMDSVVIKVSVKPGETLIAGSEGIAGSTLMTLADTSALLAEILVEEADIIKIQVGQPAAIYPVAFDDQPIVAQVTQIALSAERPEGRRTRGFRVKLSLAPSSIEARPGMSCRAEIVVNQREEVLVVPIQSVLYERTQDGSLPFVFVDHKGIARKTFVELGISDDNFQEVVTGLSANVAQITGPIRTLQSLRDGQRIRSNSIHP